MKKHWMSALLAVLLATMVCAAAQAEDLEAVIDKGVAEVGEVDLYAPEVYAGDESMDEAAEEQEPGEDGDVANAVAIDAAHFPDVVFRDYVRRFDKNGDGTLSDAECKKVERISVGQMYISSLEGIGYFPNLKYLYARGNLLNRLDVSKNRKLIELDCSRNELTALLVGNLSKLQKLVCYGNRIERMNVSKNQRLAYLDCQGNGMIDLFMGRNDYLETVICFDNNLPQLDLRYLPCLRKLDCWNNKINKLKVKNNPALEQLRTYGNTFKTLDIVNCPKLIVLTARRPVVTSVQVSWDKQLSIPVGTKLTAGKKVLYQPGKQTGVTLDRVVLNMKPGKTTYLVATSEEKQFTWTSSNPKVARVNDDGLIFAWQTGTATITVRTASGKKATCRVTVKGEPINLFAVAEWEDAWISWAFGIEIEEDMRYGEEGADVTICPGARICWNEGFIYYVAITQKCGKRFSMDGVTIGMEYDEAIRRLRAAGWGSGEERGDFVYDFDYLTIRKDSNNMVTAVVYSFE